jgi:hypothetical protein
VHLFVLGFGLDPRHSRELVDELRRTAALFPQLDHDALWHVELGDGVVAAGVASPAHVSAPRSYLHQTEDEIVFYDGLPIDPGGPVVAHRADQLAAHWDELPERLEGRFALVRITRRPLRIELLNDPLGVAQVFVTEQGATSTISNSAGLLARAADARELDPLGVSTFLAMDWVGADRTLRQGVRVVPGAQHWTWKGDGGWSKRRYWRYSDCEPPTRRVDDAFVAELSDSLGRFMESAAAINGVVNAPLTGGKDSRMLASILIGRGIPAQYWTKGRPESLDVQIAPEIARLHGLPHRLAGRPTQAPDASPPSVADDWASLTWQFVTQNDGLPSLHLVGNIHGQPAGVEHLAVTLSGLCAESARLARAQRYLDGPGRSLERAIRYIPYSRMEIPRGLVLGEAYRLARDSLRELVQRLADEGVSVRNLSTAVYLDERCRRWAANNPRELAQTEDKVLPCLTRPYAEAALRSDPDDRSTHQLHRRMIRLHAPALEHEPRLAKPWPSGVEAASRKRWLTNEVMSRLPFAARRAVVAARDRIRPPAGAWENWTAFDEASNLESNLGWAREMAVSSSGSRLWDYVDRRLLERLLDPATDASVRRVHQLPLFATLTILAYEEAERRLQSGAPVPWGGPAA